MPQLSVQVPHTLGPDEAVRRLKDKFTLARGLYQGQVQDLHEEWTDHTLSFGFKAVGMKVAGTLAVADAAVNLTADLPFAAMLFKGTIEQRVRQELGELLS
jgi:hypothetical protein